MSTSLPFREVEICRYCGKMCTFDVCTHHKECKEIPESEREKEEVGYQSMVPDVDQDWKDFIERKFEPHTFRARWKNIKCPFCREHCKNIYHTFCCPFVPPERRRVNVKIAFWKA